MKPEVPGWLIYADKNFHKYRHAEFYSENLNQLSSNTDILLALLCYIYSLLFSCHL